MTLSQRFNKGKWRVGNNGEPPSETVKEGNQEDEEEDDDDDDDIERSLN